MTDIDLDELRAELDELRAAGEEGRPLAARGADHRRLRGDPAVLSRRMAARPQHGEDRDIFERLYAVRLDRLRALEECRALLAPLDHQGLLAGGRRTR